MILFTFLPILLIAPFVWAVIDLSSHWDETENNTLWLLILLIGGTVGVVIYFLKVYQPRNQ